MSRRLLAAVLLSVCIVPDTELTTIHYAPAQLFVREHAGNRTGSLDHRLIDHLLDAVDSNKRPVDHPTEQLHVHVTGALYQITDLDQRSNLATISAYFDMWWVDWRLMWDPNEFEGVTETYLPSSAVWTPELYLYHSIEGSTPLFLQDSAVQVHQTGKIRLFLPFTARALCTINVKYFPFDSQMCKFQFGSWSYKVESIVYMVDDSSVFLGDFYDNQEWLLLNSSLHHGVTLYETADYNESYSMVIMELHLQRQSFYYVFNLVIPTTLVGLLAIIGNHAPNNSTGRRESKFRLGIMTLLSMGVMLLMVVDEMPKFALASIPGQRGSFSDVPLLGIFYITLICMISLCTCTTSLFVQLEQFALKHPQRTAIPCWLRWLDFDGRRDYHQPANSARSPRRSPSVKSCENHHHTAVEPADDDEVVVKRPSALDQRQLEVLEEIRRVLKAWHRLDSETTPRYRLSNSWTRVIARLEKTSLVIFLSLITATLLLFYFPFWY